MNKNKAVLHCKDHLVSGEEFELHPHPKFDILETRPVPENLSFYYESEDYISHTDSSENLTDKIYRLVKNYMLQKKIGWIKEIKTGGSILDLGAGTGDFLLKAKKDGWKAAGVEPNGSARALAEKKGIQLKKDSSEFSSSEFDVISMWHVLEHVPDLDAQLTELDRLLKEDGILVIAVPNYKSHDARYYGKDWAAYDVPRHLWHFSQEGITALFAERGFSLQKIEPLKFDSFYVSLLSEQHRSGRKNLIKAFLEGLRSNWSARDTSEYSSLVYFFKRA